MRFRRRAARAVAAAGLLGLALLGPVPSATGAAAAQDDDADLQLAAQDASVDAGATFTLAVAPVDLSAGSQVRVAVHDRVRSRSELERSIEGKGLRSTLHTVTTALDQLPAGAGGRSIVIDLGPEAPAGAVVQTAGVYPVAVDALDADGERTAGFVTHLVVRPAPAEATPPLDVAVIAQVGAEPAPTGVAPLRGDALARTEALVSAVEAEGDVPSTLAITPDTLEGLAGSAGAGAALVEQLRSLAASHPTMGLPYVTTSPDGLAAAGLADELERQLDRGAMTLRELLGVAPTQATWSAAPDLGEAGLRLLASLGVRRALVRPDQVERVTDGVLSPARPFELAGPKSSSRRTQAEADEDDEAVRALVLDERTEALLHAEAEPALVASHVLADLAMLWFEQPGTARAVAVPVDASVPGAAVEAVLAGLQAGSLFRPVTVDDAFAEARPLRGRDGDVLRRALEPEEPDRISTTTVAGIREVRSLRASLVEMVGSAAPVLDQVDGHVLQSLALGSSGGQRSAALADARAAVASVTDAIQTPEQVTITLTAREGTVPLTIRNDTGGPVEVRVHLRSPKLELPEGDTLSMTLTEPVNRLDVAVRTRASGSFPFEVDVTSPDGGITLATTRYRVRSTAVSGVGLVLSAGAGLFLIVWWARHWREARRSAKLVTSPHPSRREDASREKG